MQDSNQAIIIGDVHHNTLGLIRSLGIKGVNPIVYLISKTKRLGCIRSKYIKEIQFFDDEELAVKRLLEDIPNLDSKVVLYASSDAASSEIDANYELLKDYYSFFNAHGNLKNLMSKEIMCQIAEKSGLNVPERILFSKGDKIPENVPYPCITKAISSIEGIKENNLSVCRSESDLNKVVSSPTVCQTIMIEKFIDKEFEFQFIGLSLNGGEEVIIPGHSHIIRTKGIDNTYFFEYKQNGVEFNDTIAAAIRFIKQTQFSGLFSMEFLHGKDGTNYFLEMNFRNDGNAICVTDAGFNLPYIWYLYSLSKDYKEEIQNSHFRYTYFFPEYFCMKDCSHWQISLFEYFTALAKANSFTNRYKCDNQGYWKMFFKELFRQLVIDRLHVKAYLYKRKFKTMINKTAN